MSRRLFTAEEQHRTNERIHDLAQAFMWVSKRPVSKRITGALPKFSLWGVPVLLGVIGGVGIGHWLSGDSDFIAPALIAGGLCLIVLLVAFLIYMTARNERTSSVPPVFLFFEDKLFYIESDGTFSLSQIPNIAAGEIIAIRNESGSVLDGATSMRIEAECYYISCAKEFDIGNETQGLAITVIEDIVDVDVDEDDEKFFVITYENEYDEEVEFRLPMSEWGELYEWLYEQMFSN